MNNDEKLVIPVRMQFREPEYMCPECGNKFYTYKQNPVACSYCKSIFSWDIKK